MATVSLEQLTRRFGDATAVDRLTLEAPSGALVALLGPSGCGKTTTLRMIAGLLAPTSGDVRFDGQSVLRTPPEARGAVMVFQKHLLFPHLSVAENVAFGLKMRGIDSRERARRVDAMLVRVQLARFGARRPHELSSGQQQRVALARALVVAPAVLLLDEPLANLDINLRLEMRRLIRELQQEIGITTIFVTHDQEEAVMLADKVALMMDGALLQYDAPRAFYDRPASLQVARFFRNENFLEGVKHGAHVVVPPGITLLHGCEQVPDGPVVLTARPEHLRLSTEIGAPPASLPPSLPATVQSVIYMGVTTQIQLALANGATWLATVPAACSLQSGAQVRISVAPEHLWLLPPGDARR